MGLRRRKLLDDANAVNDDVRSHLGDDVFDRSEIVRTHACEHALAALEDCMRDRLADGTPRLESISEHRPDLVAEHSRRAEHDDFHDFTLAGYPAGRWSAE